MNSHYERLDPILREYIYEKQWTTLRPIQETAIPAILDTQSHILMAAGTASGKTEACFFPILTLLNAARYKTKTAAAAGGFVPNTFIPSKDGIKVLYIGPLKALINDQFQRLLPLLEAFDIPLWRWHGDIEETHKQKLLQNPEGILQITPESLEALTLRQGKHIPRLFGNLAFIIIDEVHAFIGTDRGSQLQCLLDRIQGCKAPFPRKIGISATLGDYNQAMDYINPGRKNTILLAEPKTNTGRRLSLAVDFHEESPDTPEQDNPTDPDKKFYPAVYSQCKSTTDSPGRKCIVFTNSRAEAEEAAAALLAAAKDAREPIRVDVHHGSISAALRAETEQTLREKPGAHIICATATLELGIDIGSLDRIIQIGAPVSVQAFIQRLGRSGRKSAASQMYFVSRGQSPGPAAAVVEQLPFELLKTIAIIQLYLEQRWTEGAEPKPLPLSLLYHQSIALLASHNGLPPQKLFQKLHAMPPFRTIDEADYHQLVAYLIEKNHLETTENHELIVGLEAERLLNHYSFYSVFPDTEEYRVTHAGRELGTVNFMVPKGGSLSLAGRSWVVTDVRPHSRELCVAPGAAPPGAGAGTGTRTWRGSAGNLHPVVARRMQQVLAEQTQYPYLSPAARSRLARARETYNTRIRGEKILEAEKGDGRNSETTTLYLLPWLGSRGLRTLALALQHPPIRDELKITNHSPETPYAFRVNTRLPANQFRARVKTLFAAPPNAETLIDPERVPFRDKYDYLLPPDLLAKAYGVNMLDVNELMVFAGS